MSAPQNISALRYTLTICAAHPATGDNWHRLMVCGKQPGHDGPHRDAEYAVEWAPAPEEGQP